MRGTAVVDSPRGLSTGGHLCWVYDDAESFDGALVGFLADGVARNERIVYLTRGTEVDARRSLAALGDLDALLAGGALRIDCVDDVYQPALAAPAAHVEQQATATSAALADGFAGLRVAADATGVLADRHAGDDLAEYEHLIERAMVSMPFTAMCAYDARVLGDATAEVACLHPLTNAPSAGFHLVGDRPGCLQLSGEVDALSADLFAAALRHAAGDAAGDLVVDGTRLTFIDHHGVLALDAVDTVDRVVLTTGFVGARALADLVDLRRLEIVVR